jgi:hypothetical protein
VLHGTFWLVLDVLLSAPGSCHDVTGPDMILVNLNLPDAHVGSKRQTLNAQVGCEILLPVESRLGLTVAPAAAASALP